MEEEIKLAPDWTKYSYNTVSGILVNRTRYSNNRKIEDIPWFTREDIKDYKRNLDNR